jgi:hypothetical protein
MLAACMCQESSSLLPCTPKLLAASPTQHTAVSEEPPERVRKAPRFTSMRRRKEQFSGWASVTECFPSSVSSGSWLSGNWRHLKASTWPHRGEGSSQETQARQEKCPPPSTMLASSVPCHGDWAKVPSLCPPFNQR